MLKQFGEPLLADLVHTVFIYAVFKNLMQVTRSYLFSLPYFIFCLVAMVFQVNTTKIQYFWVFLDIQIKYS